MITSTRNPTIKSIRRLLISRRYRHREQVYVAEGDRWLNEIIEQDIRPHQVLVSGGWIESTANEEQLKTLNAPWKLVDEQVMNYVSDTETPPGILFVVPMDALPIPESLTMVLILDRVANPGNLGAMLRTATAAGVDAVLLGPGCVDQYNPKVVRSSMGALLHLPISRRSWPEIELDVSGMQVWLAAAGGQIGHTQVDWRHPSAVVIGNEATGVGDEARRLGKIVSIRIAEESESLNAAVATGIILFEAVRQRSESPKV